MTNCGNITIEDARKLYERLMREETLSKYNFPTKPSSDGYYHIYVKDETKKSGRRAIKDKDLEKLKEKVYNAITCRISFKSCFELWQESKKKYIKDPEKMVSVNNTLSRDRSEYRRFFGDSDFEQRPIDEITEEDIHLYTNNILYKINFKIKTLNSYKSILLGVFKFAFQSKRILINPMDRVSFDRYKFMVERSASIAERTHSKTVVDQILAYTRKYQEEHPDFIPAYALEMQILTGMRRGEIPPLTWDDVTEECILINKEQLTIHGSRTDNYTTVGHTKNYKDRVFPITKEINILLIKLKNINNIYYSSKYLFPLKTNPSKPIGNNAVYKFYYYNVCKDLHIETDRGKIKGTHAFRRNGITNAINKGFSFEIASALYGNSPRTAEKNYYAGLDLDTARKVLDGNQ